MQRDTQCLSLANLQVITQLLNVQSTPLTISLVGGGGKTHLAFWLANLFKHQGHTVCVTTTTKMYLPDDSQYDYIERIDKLSNKVELTEPAITFIYQQQIKSEQESHPIKVQGLTFTEFDRIHQSGLFNVIIVEADGAKQLPIKAPAGHEPCIPESTNIVMAVTGAEAIFSQANPNQIHRWNIFSKLTHCLDKMEVNHNILKPLLNSPQGLFKNTPRDALKIWIINKYDLCTQPDALVPLANNLLAEQPELASIWITQLTDSAAIRNILINKGFK